MLKFGFKKTISTLLLVLILLQCISLPSFADGMNFDCKSTILMEASTGKVLFESNADQALPPASVTKVMTLLLVMEAIDSGKISLEDTVQVSDNAASMGGSQVYLEPGETMTVDEMIKCVVVSSANDAAVALAEFVAGSEEMFVEKMNARAKELKLENTHFENTNGLDDSVSNHLTSARDIAIMSRELISHKKILEYSSIWMDTIRNGAFTLSNTNRLIRFYKGANGLKTGSTSKAGFCISATALRDGMQLIAVVMGAQNRDTRNEIAKKLLDYGFANYTVASWESSSAEPIHVLGGLKNECTLICDGFNIVLGKGEREAVKRELELPETIAAPIREGDVIGKIIYTLNGEVVGESEIKAAENVDKIGFFGVVSRILRHSLLACK